MEELLQKENNYIETYFDSKDKKLKQRYIEIPKSQEQLLNEQVEDLKKQVETQSKAIEDLRKILKMLSK